MTETSHDSSGWPSIVPERDILVRARLGAEGRDDLQICGALVGGPVSPANALDGQYVAPETLFGEVAKARESGVLPGSYDEGPRAALLACIESRTSATDGTTGRDALAGALRSTMPAGEARRRVVLDAPANTSLGVLPFEGIQMSETRPFETGRAELLRYVDVPDAPARTPYAPYLRRYRALVLVGDVEQTGRVSGSLDALRGEVQAVVDALRIPGDDDVGAEVLVGSVTGSLQLRGAVERPLLLDRRGTREEREHRFRKALSRLLNASPIDVLHYIGHGEEASESKVGPQSERLSFSLPLRPEDGGRSQRVWVTGEQLAKSLRRPARLVTVSACAAAPQLAEALCGAAEHVVVMGAPVEPRFAEAWSQALYRRLFVERLPIGRAVAGARDALRAGEFEGRVWIPRHYARTLDDSAFQELPHRAFLDLQTRRLGTMEGVQQDWWLPKDEAWIDRVYVETGLSMPSPRVTDDADASDEGDGSEETLKAVVTSGPHLRGRALPHYRLIGAAG
ncbi:MAG: CHAT domain-containing protein, partial [Planctomycetota bacterium]